MMAVRNIVRIDAEKCDGCGLCVSACAEGAIRLVDGKAKLVKDEYCDGLGACLGDCPRGAITIIQREAEAFNEEAVEAHLATMGRAPQPDHAPQPAHAHGGGCPGMALRQFDAPPAPAMTTGAPSALRQWPVQLHLVPPTAPYFRDADLLLAADCAAFACGDFHARYLQGHAVAIACPKLDDTHGYVEKLAAMITEGGIRGITIVRMQVPCCGGLERLVDLAFQQAGTRVPLRRVIVGMQGEVLADETA